MIQLALITLLQFSSRTEATVSHFRGSIDPLGIVCVPGCLFNTVDEENAFLKQSAQRGVPEMMKTYWKSHQLSDGLKAGFFAFRTHQLQVLLHLQAEHASQAVSKLGWQSYLEKTPVQEYLMWGYYHALVDEHNLLYRSQRVNPGADAGEGIWNAVIPRVNGYKPQSPEECVMLMQFQLTSFSYNYARATLAHALKQWPNDARIYCYGAASYGVGAEKPGQEPDVNKVTELLDQSIAKNKHKDPIIDYAAGILSISFNKARSIELLRGFLASLPKHKGMEEIARKGIRAAGG